MIAILYALQEEIRPFLRQLKIVEKIPKNRTILFKVIYEDRPLVLCQTGKGMVNAHKGVECLLNYCKPKLIISVGYAGATHLVLKTGDFVLADTILSETPTDHFTTDQAARNLLERTLREEKMNYKIGSLLTRWKLAGLSEKEVHHQNGVLAIDMETAAEIAVAKKNRIPFASLRVIFDPIDEELPFTDPLVDRTNPSFLIAKNPKMILKIPKYFRMNQVCQRNLVKIINGFVRSYPQVI